jgi:hypothetical protein
MDVKIQRTYANHPFSTQQLVWFKSANRIGGKVSVHGRQVRTPVPHGFKMI